MLQNWWSGLNELLPIDLLDDSLEFNIGFNIYVYDLYYYVCIAILSFNESMLLLVYSTVPPCSVTVGFIATVESLKFNYFNCLLNYSLLCFCANIVFAV